MREARLREGAAAVVGVLLLLLRAARPIGLRTLVDHWMGSLRWARATERPRRAEDVAPLRSSAPIAARFSSIGTRDQDMKH